jgi:hypothetical protein
MFDSIVLTSEIVKGLIGILGAIVGYALREYKNRVTPFFQIYNIDGGSIAGWEKVPIPEPMRKILKDSFYINELGDEELFQHAYRCWDRADDIKKFWPEISEYVNKIITSSIDEEIEENLYELFNTRWFDRWFTLLVARSEISFSPSPKNKSKILDVIIDPTDEESSGVIWFSTSFGTTTLGQQLNNPAMLQKFSGFIDNLAKFDVSSIKKAITVFRSKLEKEYQIAVGIHEELKEILESYSRWLFKIAFTNLSNNPIVIKKEALVSIVDNKTNNTYTLDCSLAKKVLEKGREDFQHSASPISVRGGETIEFAIVTTKTQKEMELGQDIRNVNERGSGICRVTLNLEKPGLIKKQTVKSKPIEFK